VVGWTFGNCPPDPDPGSEDVFVRKYDASGSVNPVTGAMRTPGGGVQYYVTEEAEIMIDWKNVVGLGP
jgi:hypothetical protein